MSRAAQQYGSAFEGVFERVARASQVVCTRMPSGCRWLAGGRVKPVQTPFDWILSYRGRAALVDTKTCEGNFGYSAIERHQVEELALHSAEGTPAGYVIHMREQNRVVFVRASDLYVISMQHKRGSILGTEPRVIQLGSYDAFDPRKIFQL